MNEDFQWQRTNYRETLIYCPSADVTYEQWRFRLVALLNLLARSPEFRITDNGYQRFPGVLVTEGVQCTFRGHLFRVWSDIPGQILVVHPELPRSLVEPLCNVLKDFWRSIPAPDAL